MIGYIHVWHYNVIIVHVQPFLIIKIYIYYEIIKYNIESIKY